VLFTQKLELLG